MARHGIAPHHARPPEQTTGREGSERGTATGARPGAEVEPRRHTCRSAPHEHRQTRSVVVVAVPSARPHLLSGDKDASSRHLHIARPRCRCVHPRPSAPRCDPRPQPCRNRRYTSSAAGPVAPRRVFYRRPALSAPLRSGTTPALSPRSVAGGGCLAACWTASCRLVCSVALRWNSPTATGVARFGFPSRRDTPN